MEGFEADDLIASYAEAAVREGWDVTIVSSDKDLMQLIREPADGAPQVDMLDTMKNVRLGLEAVNEKFGVTPDLRSEEHTSELQSLMRTSYAVFCLKKKKHTK